MDNDLKRRLERLEQPAAVEAKWEGSAEARAQVKELVAMVREYMGPNEQSSVAEYVRKHAPEEPRTDIERVMVVLKAGMQRAEEQRAREHR